MNDLMEQLMAEIKKAPPMLSARQLCELRERARTLQRWNEVANYTQKLWALGYYD